MKTKVFFSLMIAVVCLFAACDDDDDKLNVPESFKTAFSTRYPDVTRVNWEREGQFYVADFWRQEYNTEAEAWFNKDAVWKMTVTDLHYNGLPEAVRQGFQESNYSTWRVDDSDIVERSTSEDALLYVLEVESGRQEYDLVFAPDGVLKSAQPHNKNKHTADYITW